MTEHHPTTNEARRADGIHWFLALNDQNITSIAAREAASRHYIDPDDVAQAVRIAVSEEWDQFKTCDSSQAKAMFRRRARQYIDKEVADYMYFSGAFIYTPAQIRHQLETEDIWADGGAGSDSEARADLLAAWKRLSPARQQAVYKRYGPWDGEDITESQARACRRGVEDMAVFLNRKLPEAVNTSSELI